MEAAFAGVAEGSRAGIMISRCSCMACPQAFRLERQRALSPALAHVFRSEGR
jgi:hypothetical protein